MQWAYPAHMAPSLAQINERRSALALNAARLNELRRIHAAVADQLQNPTTTRAKALIAQAERNIATWEQGHTCSPTYIRAWRRILRNPSSGLHRLMAGNAATVDAMLQNTPFGFALHDPAFRR